MPLNPGSSAFAGDSDIPAMDSANPPFPKQVHALQWGLLDSATDAEKDEAAYKARYDDSKKRNPNLSEYLHHHNSQAPSGPGNGARTAAGVKNWLEEHSYPDAGDAVDGGDGSGVPARHNSENLPDIKSSLGNIAEDKKRFTETLHNRRSNGTFEPSSERGLTRRKHMEEVVTRPEDEDDERR